VVSGDLRKVDLPRGTRSGLRDAMDILHKVKGIGFATFTDSDVVRHPLVGEIVHAYSDVETRRRTGARYEPELQRDIGNNGG